MTNSEALPDHQERRPSEPGVGMCARQPEGCIERIALQGMQTQGSIPWVLSPDLQPAYIKEREGEREKKNILRVFHWFLKLSTFY